MIGSPAEGGVEPAQRCADGDKATDITAVERAVGAVGGAPAPITLARSVRPVQSGLMREVDGRSDAALTVGDDIHLLGTRDLSDTCNGVGHLLGLLEAVSVGMGKGQREGRASSSAQVAGRHNEYA